MNPDKLDDYGRKRECYVRQATRHAAIALLWQATDTSENGGHGFPIEEVTPCGDAFTGEGAEYIDAVKPLIEANVRSFVEDNYITLGEANVSPKMCGHDLVLTANRHGAGFWDRGLGEAGQKLTKATRGYSFDAEFELFGDDRATDDHCADELAWLAVENTVLVDHLNYSTEETSA